MWKSRKDSRAKIYYDHLFTAHISIYRQTEYRHVAIVASTIVMFNCRDLVSPQCDAETKKASNKSDYDAETD